MKPETYSYSTSFKLVTWRKGRIIAALKISYDIESEVVY
jgi:hypothetical protein